MRPTIALLIGLILLAALALSIDAATVSPAEQRAAAAWAAGAAQRAEILSISIAMLAAVTIVTVAGLAVILLRKASIWSITVHPKNGVYPLIGDGRAWIDYNAPGVQHIAALPARPTAALARALLNGPAPAPALPVTIEGEIVDRPFDGAVDLVSRPHTILLGRTGSGKSTAGYAIAEAIRQQYPVEFLIGEPGGVAWGRQCAASDVRDIGALLVSAEQEMRRRQSLLVEADAQHITELPSPPPFWVLLLEELEDTLDSLRIISQGEAQRAKIALRNIAREGRKPGICLLAITQFGKSDVLDSHVRHNMGALYLFQNSANVGQMLRLPSSVRLDKLPVGTAYSYHDAAMIPFPKSSRPALPAVHSTGTSQNTVIDMVQYPVQHPVPGTVAMPTTLDEPITEAQRQAVLDAYARHQTIKGVQRELFPGQQLGGHWFYWIRSIVEGA